MSALSTLGIIHTAISLVAVGAGVRAFFRYKGITLDTGAGTVYLAMTVLTCVTGFFIFAHGGFGKPHALGVITLVVIGAAIAARFTGVFGRAAAAVETVAYSLTFFFHMIPAVTETSTRLPAGAPMVDSPESPVLQAVTGIMLVIFLIGATLQVRRLRGSTGQLPGSKPQGAAS